MKAAVLTIHNPFDPLGSRRILPVSRRRRIRALAPRGNRPVIAMLNGRPVLRAEWRRKLADGDQLVFCVLPRDGAGNGGSNPLRVILSLAVLVFAPWAAGALLGANAATVLVGSFTLGQATTLGIALAGNAVVNALLPTRQPAQLPAPSPTYSIGAQGNTARLDQAIAVQYGRLLVYPDFAAQPYVEFAGNEQYLYQLLCLGAGDYDIEEIRIEDTEISAFTEIETEIVMNASVWSCVWHWHLHPAAAVAAVAAVVAVSLRCVIPLCRRCWLVLLAVVGSCRCCRCLTHNKLEWCFVTTMTVAATSSQWERRIVGMADRGGRKRRAGEAFRSIIIGDTDGESLHS